MAHAASTLVSEVGVAQLLARNGVRGVPASTSDTPPGVWLCGTAGVESEITPVTTAGLSTDFLAVTNPGVRRQASPRVVSPLPSGRVMSAELGLVTRQLALLEQN
jgi:hypothetical protein